MILKIFKQIYIKYFMNKEVRLMFLNENEILNYVDEVNFLLKSAYVPYSKFPVAALLIDNNGNKHKGVNVENASFGLTICAERNAITTAVTENMKKIKLLVITGNTFEPISPCGACRQVIKEFSDKDTVIILTNKKRKYKITSVEELLPYSFSSENL